MELQGEVKPLKEELQAVMAERVFYPNYKNDGL